MSNLRMLDSTSTFFYTLLLGLVSLHFFRLPDYDMDMLGYMGNALLMQETDPGRIHETVYTEVAEHVPAGPRQHLLGLAGRADQDDSRKDRAANAYHFAEFLPCFAIRPLYNQTVYVLSKSGIGLVRAVVLISTVSTFRLGCWSIFGCGDTCQTGFMRHYWRSCLCSVQRSRCWGVTPEPMAFRRS